MEDAGKIGSLSVPDYKHREENYKEALKSCDCREWLKVIHTLRQKKAERTERGKSFLPWTPNICRLRRTASIQSFPLR